MKMVRKPLSGLLRLVSFFMHWRKPAAYVARHGVPQRVPQGGFMREEV
jgi:hypothetical protein